MRLYSAVNDRGTQWRSYFHARKDSEQSLRPFAEKRAEFLTRELRDLNAEELKALLSTERDEINLGAKMRMFL